MLDEYLKVMAQLEKKASDKDRTVELMSRLPKSTLIKIANGVEKVGHGDDDDWLEKYRGSPLLSKAVELEKQLLQVESEALQERQERAQERESSPDEYDLKQQIRIQKKLLDLEFSQEGLDVQAPVDEPVAEEPAAPEEGLAAPLPPGPAAAAMPPPGGPPGMGAEPIKAAAAKWQKMDAGYDILKRLGRPGSKYKGQTADVRQKLLLGKRNQKPYSLDEMVNERGRAGASAASPKTYDALRSRSLRNNIGDAEDAMGSAGARSKARKARRIGEAAEKSMSPKNRLASQQSRLAETQAASAAAPVKTAGVGSILGKMLTKAPRALKAAGSFGKSGFKPGVLKGGTFSTLSRLAKPASQAGQRFTGFAKASAAKTTDDTSGYLYGAVPGLLGGSVTGMAQGAYLSNDAAEMAKRVGENPISAAKKSALGQIVGGGGGSAVEALGAIALKRGGTGRTPGRLLGGHVGSYAGHRVATKRLRAADEARSKTSSIDGENFASAARTMLMKSAQAKMDAGYEEDLTDLEKEAFVGALKGFGRAVLGAGKTLKGGAMKGVRTAKDARWGGGPKGPASFMDKAKAGFQGAAGKIGKLSKENPMGLAGVGAGALGGAALLGGGVGAAVT